MTYLKSKTPAPKTAVSGKLVSALQGFKSRQERLTYSCFAKVCFATGDATSPKFQPFFFGLLNALPEGLDALVVRKNGECPEKHAKAACNVRGWAVVVVISEAELAQIS